MARHLQKGMAYFSSKNYLSKIFHCCDKQQDIICKEKGVTADQTTVKKWTDWNVDYLKHHVTHKCHLHSAEKLKNLFYSKNNFDELKIFKIEKKEIRNVH